MQEITFALAAVLFAIWFLWRWRHTSIFIKLGIPGPKPNFFFGNMVELYKKGPIECHKEWVAEYGNVVGYFYGMRPILLVADPQLLKNIYIKDFSKFTDRELFSPLVKPIQDEEINQSVLSLRGQKWKEIRSILSPTFTTSKMKQMVSTINTAIDDMIGIMREYAEKGEVFDIHDTHQRLTMDVISRTAFGVIVDVQRDKDSQLLKGAKLLFRQPFNSPFVFLGLSFPLLRRIFLEMQILLLRILNRGISPANMLRSGLKKVLKHRKENPKHRKADLLQLMIDSKISSNATNVDIRKLEAGDPENEKAEDEKKEDNTSKVSLSADQIIASSVGILLAGYETTSTALSFTAYLLGKHQHIQDKLYEEIQDLIRSGEKIEYATINKLPYMEKVFNESLRIYPPVHLFTNRYASEDVTYGSLTIPEGMIVQAPTYLLHHDAEYWQDPETFDPERFNSKPNTDGMIYFPFGIGPRNCLGMRFAQMEAKMALANTIHNFRITLPKEQEDNLKVAVMIRTLTLSGGVKVKLEIRDKETSL